MAPGAQTPDEARRAQLTRELHRDVAQRRAGYREQALRVLPHVCASCGRSFSGPRLRELTVHHRDHNFKNNPPDGSNWELLCIYCHDHEHDKSTSLAGYFEGRTARRDEEKPALGSPFAQLDSLLGRPEEPAGEPPEPDPTA
jgi:5-methylcytosine-specific restriction endonuclease McrA